MQTTRGKDSRTPASGASEDAVRAVCARHGNDPAALIEIMHDLQAEAGMIADTALPVIAQALNLSRAEVYGVVSFYHDFRREPAGRHVLKLCMAESCQAMGAERLAEAITRSLAVAMGGTTSDGSVTLEPVYCLGNCALSPAAMLDGELIGRASAERLRERLAAVVGGRS